MVEKLSLVCPCMETRKAPSPLGMASDSSWRDAGGENTDQEEVGSKGRTSTGVETALTAGLVVRVEHLSHAKGT